MAVPAETPFRRDILQRIYERQFRELAPLRRHVFSILPLNRVRTIFEPGCGTGLLAGELKNLTSASYTGMDIDPLILPHGEEFIAGDAVKNPLRADLYVTSFFFSSVKNPQKWLLRVRKQLAEQGLFAVFAEYDYQRIDEQPDMKLAPRLRDGLSLDGIVTTNGGKLDEFFESAGFRKLAGGDAESRFCLPDPEFITALVKEKLSHLPYINWRIVWGVWRKT
jgi:SAM-dependent methyltransferase